MNATKVEELTEKDDDQKMMMRKIYIHTHKACKRRQKNQIRKRKELIIG